jgi:hypothetical protein
MTKQKTLIITLILIALVVICSLCYIFLSQQMRAKK